MILEPIRNLLLQAPDVSIIVGNRIYPLRIPRDRRVPAIVLTSIDELTDPTTLVHQSRIQIDCYANTYADTTTLAHRVRAALMNTTHTGPDITILSIISSGGGMDGYEDENRIYRTSEDVQVTWRYTP